MFIVRKQFRFEASHQLKDHDGKCARLHGHSWVGTVEVRGDALVTDGPKRNMIVDYGDISSVVKPLVEEYLDHHHLNDTLASDMPTSESVALWVYVQLAPKLAGLYAVEIEETCTSCARYEGK